MTSREQEREERFEEKYRQGHHLRACELAGLLQITLPWEFPE